MVKSLMLGIKNHEESKDLIQAFAIDNLFKIIMMKVDDII